MVNLDEIKKSLDSNQNMTPEVKDELFHLITIFHQQFPSVSLDTLNARIKDLKVGKITLHEQRGPVSYDARGNEILLSAKDLEERCDPHHLMMKGLLGVISASDNYYGFNQNDSLCALNMGFTEMLANTLVGNEGACDYEEELLAANLISDIIGVDTMFEAYFNNDTEAVYKSLLDADEDELSSTPRVKNIMDLLNSSFLARPGKVNTPNNTFPEALKDIALVAAHQEWSPAKEESFKQKLSLSTLMDRSSEYVGIVGLQQVYEAAKESAKLQINAPVK